MQAKLMKWTKRGNKEKSESTNKPNITDSSKYNGEVFMSAPIAQPNFIDSFNQIDICRVEDKMFMGLNDSAKNINFIPMPMQRRNAICNKNRPTNG